MEINPTEHSKKDIYKLLIGSVAPRPIAWVSTISTDGIYNLAPYSFFNAVVGKPPTVVFCPGMRDEFTGEKDTYDNVVATGEFIVNFVNEDLKDAMNATSAILPPAVDEFERAGVTPVMGKTVNVPYVKESPIHFECKLHEIVTIGEPPTGGHLVIGTVTHMYFDDAVYKDGYVDIEAYRPIGRLAGRSYTYVRDIFDMERP